MTKRLTAYNQALQEFNLGKSNFTFVKKGSEDYDKVKEIEARIKKEKAETKPPPVPEPKPKPKGGKTKTAKPPATPPPEAVEAPENINNE